MIFTKPKPIKVVLLSACLITFSISAWSLPNEKAKQQKYQCKVISKSQAIYNAKGRIKGKVVAANLVEKGNRSVYKVRVLIDKKRVKTITIPACK